MKLTLILTLWGIVAFASQSYSQLTRVSLNMKHASIIEVFSQIEDQTDYQIAYNSNELDQLERIDLKVNNKSINEVLGMLLKNSNVQYEIIGRYIIISDKKDREPGVTVSGNQQTLSVKGRVVNPEGSPIPGATIVIKGTTVGTITDSDGNYILPGVPPNSVLSVSFVGMKAQETLIEGRSVINFQLDEETIGLEEVVAIGYGTMKKSDLTGSIGSVKSENLVSKGSTSVMEGLQGQIAGVNIQQVSSRSGDGFSIQIRGKSSMQGGEPLYVIDGVVCDNMNFLNPMDIEKIDVLKDASSTAIYGSRATNGVLIITTKKGTGLSKDTKTVVSYDGYYGVRKVAHMPDFMTGDEFMKYRFSRYVSSTLDATTGASTWNMTDANFRNFWGGDSPVVKQFYTNKNYTYWPDIVLRDGQQQNHFINIAGNSRDISYRVGVGYQSEKGMLYDGYERWNMKASFDSKISDKFTVGFNANLATALQNKGSQRSVQTGFNMTPVMPCYYWEGENKGELILQPGKDEAIYPSGGGPTSTLNPVVDRMNSTDDVRSYYVMANTYLQYTPIRDVVLKTTFSPMYTKTHNGVFY